MNDTIAKRVEFAHLLDEAIALGKVIRFGGVLVDDLFAFRSFGWSAPSADSQ
ncbi:hypothetical protein [Mesorhizobium sp.]|uniref:hypothetical protein n=1 Tax=Mesorhizobium sp. TaxID=1871066 RepID=UPI00257D9A95|nr:hypothetical protein [Mesorhizobium sp.]